MQAQLRADEGNNQGGQPVQDNRDSIWTIPLAWRALYFGLFTFYALAGIGFLIWYHVFEGKACSWPETILSITQGIGINTVGAAGLALLTIEGPNTIMVVANYITERWLNPLKERRRVEAERIRSEAEAEAERIRAEAEAEAERIRAEAEVEAETIRLGATGNSGEVRASATLQVHSAWQAWNRRRLAAESRGETFDEPPPETPTDEGK